MFDFELIINTGVPKGATLTPYAMMPKIFCVIEGTGARVFYNRKLVKKFIYFENGIRRKNRVFEEEEKKAIRIFNALTKNGKILLKESAS